LFAGQSVNNLINMSDSVPEVPKVEEPVATSAPTEVPAATEAAPEKTEAAPAADAAPAAAAATEAPANGAEKTEEEAKEGSDRKGGFQRNGQDRGPRVFKRYESKSKFDPSKLPITDNPSEIRAQVCAYPFPSFLTNADWFEG
jgi:hypothetical protein